MKAEIEGGPRAEGAGEGHDGDRARTARGKGKRWRVEWKGAVPYKGRGMSSLKGVDEFIVRWGESGASERANYQLFLSELCDVLGAGRPAPTTGDEGKDVYVFEKAVAEGTGRQGTGGRYAGTAF